MLFLIASVIAKERNYPEGSFLTAAIPRLWNKDCSVTRRLLPCSPTAFRRSFLDSRSFSEGYSEGTSLDEGGSSHLQTRIFFLPGRIFIAMTSDSVTLWVYVSDYTLVF